jgi:hypothetical protein
MVGKRTTHSCNNFDSVFKGVEFIKYQECIILNIFLSPSLGNTNVQSPCTTTRIFPVNFFAMHVVHKFVKDKNLWSREGWGGPDPLDPLDPRLILVLSSRLIGTFENPSMICQYDALHGDISFEILNRQMY